MVTDADLLKGRECLLIRPLKGYFVILDISIGRFEKLGWVFSKTMLDIGFQKSIFVVEVFKK